jgi:hypothetical protein
MKPQCSNCVRRDVRCSFLAPTPCASHPSTAGSSRSLASTPDAGSYTSDASRGPDRAGVSSKPRTHRGPPSDALSAGLDVSDFPLLHHYTISTSHTLVVVPGLQTFMRVNIPQIAFSDRFLLHGVLAIAALHLSRFKNAASEVNFYMTKALHHYGIALREATVLMGDVDANSGPALYLFSMLCFNFTLGLGPKPGDFLLFGNMGISDWLAQLRGMRILLETNPEILHHEKLSPLFEVSIRNIAHKNSGIYHLPELRERILQVGPPELELKICMRALDQLSERFDAGTSHARASHIFPQQVFVWLYLLEDEFIHLLQEKRPIALVILSYFCILLNNLGTLWWVRGWTEHLLSEIHSCLSQEYRIWMHRPKEETGWIPG